MYGKALSALIAVLLLIPASAGASDTVYLTGGTARGRSLAMGSAYSSLEDDFSSGLYNPATFRVNAARSERRFRLLFNPLGSATAFREYSRYDFEYAVDREMTGEESFRAAALLLKGAVLTGPVVDVGVVFHEPVISDDSTRALAGRFLSMESVTREAFHTAFMNVKIAPTVSLGLSGSLYRTREGGKDKYRSGHTFGVLLDPTPKMKVGLAYIQLPEETPEVRTELEDLGSGTITGGVSYYPDERTVISLDVRNMNRDDRPASREIHAGAERVLGHRIALRAGYFRKKDTSDDVYSLGIGVLPVWGHISKYRYSTRNDLLSYTFVAEEGAADRQWHVFSLLMRF